MLTALQDAGIGCAVNYRAVHLRKYYIDKYGHREGDFPIAERIGERTITLPLYPRLTDEEVSYVKDRVIELHNRVLR